MGRSGGSRLWALALALVVLAGAPSASRAETSTQPAGSTWTTILDDTFDSGALPDHWLTYDGRYGSGPHNCAAPSQDYVANGALHLVMSHQSTGECGSDWYTGGMMVDRAHAGVNQRVTVRWRIVPSGVFGVRSHRIIPMRWPNDDPWPQGGEEDLCEGSAFFGCTTFLHYADAFGADEQHFHDHWADLQQWHTMRFQHVDHTVTAWIDDLNTPAWIFRGDAKTVPDTSKRVVLQQECRSLGCPTGVVGREDIQIDRITIENLAPAPAPAPVVGAG